MQFKKVVPYKIRRLIPMLGMAGATLLMGGCEKEEPIVPTRDVEITFDIWGNEGTLYKDDENGNRGPSDLALYYLNDPTVRDIYYVPVGSWSNFTSSSITALRKVTLETIMNYSPRFKARGDFTFMVGEASKVPEDSLWYVSKGWTINKKFTEQQKQR